jgi:hypothetical protein
MRIVLAVAATFLAFAPTFALPADETPPAPEPTNPNSERSQPGEQPPSVLGEGLGWGFGCEHISGPRILPFSATGRRGGPWVEYKADCYVILPAEQTSPTDPPQTEFRGRTNNRPANGK